VIRVDSGTDLIVEDLGPEADSAQIVAHVLSPGLGPDLSRSQVHAQELARVAGHGRGRRRGLLLRSGRGRGGAHWTITFIGPSPGGAAGVNGKPARDSSRAGARAPCGSRGRRA